MIRSTLRQLEYFLAVVDHGSMTAAAESCHVSPGTIALAMNELEKALNLRLLVRRKSKGITVTRAGWIAAEKARTILLQAAELDELAGQLQGELVGAIKVGCFSALSPWLMPRLLEHFTVNHPRVTIDIVEGSSKDLQELLLAGKLDVCLIYSAHLLSGVRGIRIRDVRLCVVVGQADEFAGRGSIALREMRDRPVILLNLPPTKDLVEDVLSSADIIPSVKWRSSNAETVKSAVARGLAYSVLNGPLPGTRDPDGGPVAYLTIEDDLPENAIVAAVPRGEELTAKVQGVIDFCQQELAE